MADALREPLSRYRAKRNFSVTPEPPGVAAAAGGATRSFVIQKHAATRLHYDFRLELGGVLLSWALPKGPSYDPADKRMAIHVEDHPLSYASFEGTIPPGQYGAGTVIVWDRGTWQPVGDPEAGLAQGKLVFSLHGHKMFGLWELVKIARPGDRQEPWILFKKRDGWARPRSDYDVVSALPDSVAALPLQTPQPPQTQTLRPPAAAPTASARRRSKAGAAPAAGGVAAALPDKLTPQLATLSTAVPAAGEWRYEIKFDGYRLMARIEAGAVRLITRGGHDWTRKMPDLAAALAALGLSSAWLDGEIVVLNADGTPDFNGLQQSLDQPGHAAHIVYFVFDLPYCNGWDLRPAAWRDRRECLQNMLAGKSDERIRFSADFTGEPASILSSACRMGLEGLIVKRADAPYVSSRTETWLKLKCKQRQEFVICGYTDRSDGSPQIGSLLLGVHDDGGRLVSVGSVGTGWNTETAKDLLTQLAPLGTTASPFGDVRPKTGRWSRRTLGSERWVQPRCVAEVEFADWTPDGQIRHASFVALRDDKPAAEVVRETARTPAGATRPVGSASVARPAVSHGERVIDVSTGLTKLDLVRYYESVAPWILPHLRDRPVSLVRGPKGIAGPLFFQKHGDKIGIPNITELDAALWPGHEALLAIDSAEALAGAAQMNVIELHTWNSRVRDIDRPDRMVFDLDPGDGTQWPQIQEAATLVRGFLQELGLQSWLKTSGGKGLHVVVPLRPERGYDEVKTFSHDVVLHLARVLPSRFVAKSGAANRLGKIFVDYLRNGHGATTATAFSARARPGMGVSMPVSWDELQKLKSGAQWTVATAREHLSFQTVDPWADYAGTPQALAGAIATLRGGAAPQPAPAVKTAKGRRAR